MAVSAEQGSRFVTLCHVNSIVKVQTRCEPQTKAMFTLGSHFFPSSNQGSFQIDGRLCADVLYTVAPFAA